MELPGIETITRQHADNARRYATVQVKVWQRIPLLVLEAHGRGGWVDNWHIPYVNGVLGVDDKWPNELFVELATGRLVQNLSYRIIEAPDDLIAVSFLRKPELFDATARVATFRDMIENEPDYPGKEENEAYRAELRKKYRVPRRWTKPATPIAFV